MKHIFRARPHTDRTDVVDDGLTRRFQYERISPWSIILMGAHLKAIHQLASGV